MNAAKLLLPLLIAVLPLPSYGESVEQLVENMVYLDNEGASKSLSDMSKKRALRAINQAADKCAQSKDEVANRAWIFTKKVRELGNIAYTVDFLEMVSLIKPRNDKSCAELMADYSVLISTTATNHVDAIISMYIGSKH